MSFIARITNNLRFILALPRDVSGTRNVEFIGIVGLKVKEFFFLSELSQQDNFQEFDSEIVL